MDKRTRILILLIAFFEGGIILTGEMAANHLVAPWLGTSVYLWSGILLSALSGLAAGYYSGARLSQKGKLNYIYFVLPLIVALNLLMPWICDAIMPALLNTQQAAANFLATFVMLFPVSVLCGIVSPVLIELLSASQKMPAGKSAGIIFCVSTAGGFIAALAFSFFLIPVFGTRTGMAILSLLLLVPTALCIFSKHLRIYITPPQ
jgi:hypothetical protein